MIESLNYQLIQVTTDDQIRLSGLHSPGDKNKPVVILIHGFTADFYSHPFYHSIKNSLEKQGIGYLLAQTRGTGLHTEFIRSDNSGVYIGSFYEKIEEAHLDISAFVEYLLNEGYSNIVLAGHSLGTIKAVRYLFEGRYRDKINELILLAPFDKNAFMVRKAGDRWDEFLEVAERKVESGKGYELVPVPVYEDFPLTYETFISWYNKSDLSCIWDFYRKDYKGELLSSIKIPVKVILGENDEFVDYPEFDESSQSVLKFLQEKIPFSKTYLVKGSNHTYQGHENEVAEEISKFLMAKK